MAFCDKNKVPVQDGDIVEYKGKRYQIKAIESYDMATEIIVENIKTFKVETLLLRDVKKI